MLTRWGSILKVTHSVVTMGWTDGRRPVNGIPHSSPLARKGFGSPPMRTLNGHWRWSGAVRAAERDSFVTSSFESAVGSSLPEALFDFWPPS